jgi:hypothetical protein
MTAIIFVRIDRVEIIGTFSGLADRSEMIRERFDFRIQADGAMQ